MSFDISIFEGDPARGPNHKGFMYVIRVRGVYRKSVLGWINKTVAVNRAVIHIGVIEACLDAGKSLSSIEMWERAGDGE